MENKEKRIKFELDETGDCDNIPLPPWIFGNIRGEIDET